jgi:integrase
VQISGTGSVRSTNSSSDHKRTDATRWARELEAEADRSGWVADTRLAEKTTLGELLTRYRDQVSPSKRSAHTERSRINAMLRRPIVHRTLSKLTSADVATYRDERLKDVAPATVVRELNTLSHAIETALREWGLWLPRNPVKMVRRPTVPQGRKRRLEDGEEQRLLAACDRGRTPLLKQLVILAIETGMRRGELLGLRWEYARYCSQHHGPPSHAQLAKWLHWSEGQVRRKLDRLKSLYAPGGPWASA